MLFIHHNSHTSSPGQSLQRCADVFAVWGIRQTRSKIGQRYIFIRGEWASVFVCKLMVWCLFTCNRRRESSTNGSIKAACDCVWLTDGPSLVECEVVSSLRDGDIYTWYHQTLLTSSVTDVPGNFSRQSLCISCGPGLCNAALPSKFPLLGSSGYLRMLSLMHRCLKGLGGIGLQFSLLIKN